MPLKLVHLTFGDLNQLIHAQVMLSGDAKEVLQPVEIS
jgi:hypothetical protein